MSKDGALSMLTGVPTVANPGVITSDMPKAGEPLKVPVSPEKINLESDRFAKLAAREAALVKQREVDKLEKAEFEKQKEALKKVQTDISEFEELKKTDKIAALKKIGFTEEDIFNFMAGKEEPKELTAQEIAEKAASEATQKLRDEMKTDAEKALNERNDKAIKAYKAEITNQIAKETEKYELCSHNGAMAEEIIYETILGFMSDDRDLSPLDAMKEAIEAVEQMYESEYQNMSKLKKLQPKVVEIPPEPVKPKPMLNHKPMPTLNNKATATVASTIPKTTETKSQKRERLENALRNMGKN